MTSGSERPFVPVRFAVLAVSDTRTLADDKSGATLTERIEAAGHVLADRAIVPDDRTRIRETVERWIADPKVDARPNALVLYNPALAMTSPTVIGNLTKNWGPAVAAHARDFSPIDHLDKRLPPAIIFQGTADKGVSPQTAQDFCRRARALKVRCDVVLYPGAPHGFSEVWLGLQDPVDFPRTEFWAEDTSRRTDRFLASLGWLPSH